MAIPDKEWIPIIQKYTNALHAQALKFTKDPDESNDIVSETFLIAYEKRDEIRDVSKIGSYLKKTCYRLCCLWFKVNQKYILFDHRYYSETLEDGQPGPDSYLLYNDIMTAVNELPDEYKDVFILKCLEDLSHQEIHDELGILEKTSRSRLSKAKERLREVLVED